MKHKLPFRNNRKIQKIIFRFFLVLLFFSFIFYLITIYDLFIPVNKKVSQITNKVTTSISNKDGLISENKRLKEEIELLKKHKDILEFYIKQNQELKKELLFDNSLGLEKIFIDLDDQSNIYSDSFIILNNNFLDKLSVGDLVFSKYNLLIGKITRKTNKSAEITLFSKNNFKQKFLLKSGNDTLLVDGVGMGGGIIKVVVPRQIEFSLDDIFLESPSGEFLIAKKVDEVFKPQDSERILYFQLVTNPALISKVGILVQSNNIFNNQNESI